MTAQAGANGNNSHAEMMSMVTASARASYQSKLPPGVHCDPNGVTSVVGTNGRRLIVARMPDGLCLGDVVMDTQTVLDLAVRLRALGLRMQADE